MREDTLCHCESIRHFFLTLQYGGEYGTPQECQCPHRKEYHTRWKLVFIPSVGGQNQWPYNSRELVLKED